jgi:hypothetical protein
LKIEGKQPLGSFRGRSENNIKININEMGGVEMWTVPW